MSKLPFNRHKVGSRIVITADPNAASPSDGRNTGFNPNNDIVNADADNNTTDYNAEQNSSVIPIVIGAILVGIIVYAMTD